MTIVDVTRLAGTEEELHAAFMSNAMDVISRAFGVKREVLEARMRADAKKSRAPTATQLKAAMEYERTHGAGTDRDRASKVANHVAERPAYYIELSQMLEVPAFAKSGGGGPFIGPRGGKWADAAFTIPWQEGGAQPEAAGAQQPVDKHTAAASKQPKAQPKALPRADQLGVAGAQVVEAVRKQNPEAAQQLETALGEIVTGLRARQAGAKSPEGDSSILENLKAFGRAFNQSAAPASVLGPDLGGMIEAAEKTRKRDEAAAQQAQNDAMGDAAGRAQSAIDAAGTLDASGSPPAAAQAPAQGGAAQQDAGAQTDAGAGPQEPAASPAGAAEAEQPVEYGFAPQADDGIVDVFGIGSPDEVNRQFGHDPQGEAATQQAQSTLASLDQQHGSVTETETEAAVREAAGASQETGKRRDARAQTAEESRKFSADLANSRAKRDKMISAANADREQYDAGQKGKPGLGTMVREDQQLAGQPAKVEISAERAEAGTNAGQKRKKRAAPPAEAQVEKSLVIPRARRAPTMTATMLKSLVPAGTMQGQTAGSAPRETPAIPDYQAIYFQPPDDDRKRREDEITANRRASDGERTRGAFGFHGSGDVRLEPSLFYVPTLQMMTQVAGEQLANREPMVLPDEVARIRAGGSAGPPKDGVAVDEQTDAGRVSRSPDRRDDALAPAAPEGPRPSPVDSGRETYQRVPDEDDAHAEALVAAMSDEMIGTWTREGLAGFMSAGFRNARALGLMKSEVMLEALYKSAGAHKYIRRVPTGDPKRPWRYYYAESAIARDVTAGEEVRVGKDLVKVVEVGKDGAIRIEIDGKPRDVQPDEWANLLARNYGTRFHEWAEKRAEQSINAVLKHVPKAMLEDLPGDTDEERFAALEKRVPAVHAKLKASFARAGVNPFRAKRILATALERRGWEPEARAAAIGSVLTRKTSATRFSEIVRGAENIAGGARVEAKHVATVVELCGDGPDKADDFSERIVAVARRAEAELARLSAMLAKAHEGSNTDRANALAAVLGAEAVQRLNLLATAFPGLTDRAVEPAREIVLEAAALAPHVEPKRDGGSTHVYVAGENGQPKAVKATYRLMEADEIVASHDPIKGFTRRADYPEGVQERAYHRDQSEQGKVIRNAQTLNPAFLVNTNPDAVNGPPVITKEGHALGGNSRTMSMQLAYDRHPEKAAELRAYLEEHAHEVGFRPEDVKALKNPVLVRVIEPDDTTKQGQQLLVRQLNESFTQAMDPRTMQVAMGRKLDEQTLSALGNDMGAEETLAAFLASPRSERFVNALTRNGIVDQRNGNQYLKKGTKLLNEDGRTMVERILVGRLVGDADVLSNTGVRVVGNLANAVPYMVQAKAHGAGYDVGSDLAVAVSAFNDLQHRVETGTIPALDPKMDDRRFKGLFNYFDSLFDDKHPVVDNNNARALLELLIRKPGPQQQAAVWRDYAKRAGQNPEGQTSLLGASKTPSAVLLETVQSALKSTADDEPKPPPKKQAETASLF